ncbi:NADH:flavin oxidoreductase / NADH oxidase family protein [Streptococcus downei MFe28]|uniref:NADH:flavin oxidoreductase / NADH oxidase family protein n=1 Tax=Streptococcus downei MFe28 TaxID=764290 RepID=A0A380JFQ1_STRDO|nr:NADH:flavin oxidoreductase / NADH oxidase family protein [Streptococcus downei MFe28]
MGDHCLLAGIRIPEQLGIYDDTNLESVKSIAQALKKDGNKAILQSIRIGVKLQGRLPKAKKF